MTYLDICSDIIIYSCVTFVTLAFPAAFIYLVVSGIQFWRDR